MGNGNDQSNGQNNGEQIGIMLKRKFNRILNKLFNIILQNQIHIQTLCKPVMQEFLRLLIESK